MALTKMDVQELKEVFFNTHPGLWQEDVFFTVLKQLPPFFIDKTVNDHVYPYVINDVRQAVEKCQTFIKNALPLRIANTTDLNILQEMFLILKHCYQTACLVAFYDQTLGFVLPRSLIQARDTHAICNVLCDRINYLNRIAIFNEFHQEFVE